MLKPLFFNLDFTLSLFQPAGWLTVQSARWAGEGGPDTATLSGANAGRLDLATALTFLRCPVELVDDSGMPAWWGYVSAIEMRSGSIITRADLEPMANRVKAVYTARPLETNQWSSIGLESAWYEDCDSQASYGIKERVIHLYDSTPIQAVAACNLALQENAWPQAQPAIIGADLRVRPGVSPSPDIVFHLRGWFHTLGWKFYANPDGLIENLYEGPGFQFVGGSTGDQNIYQSFTVASGDWRAHQVWLKAAIKANPIDSLQVDICEDSGGSPGSSVASGTVSHTAMTSTFTWLCFDLTSPPVLSAGVYWLWVHRTGANNGSSKYVLKADEFESYTGGLCRVGASPRTPAADLLFKIAGSAETSAQIAAMAIEAGQFLAGARLDASSGIYTNPFRAGALTALQEILNHLRAGNADSVKLQAEVTQDRCLRVWLKPGPATAELTITQEGLLADRWGKVLPAWTPAAGRWALVSGAWGETGSAYLQVRDRVLLDAVEYDPASGGLRPG
jgi:hypothetical protein